MSAKITQREKVIDYITRYGSITSWEAYIELGITQLGARIFELKREGYKFNDEFVSRLNRDKQPVLFKKYYFADNNAIPVVAK